MNRLRNIFGCDVRSLALFRIALALVLFYDVADRFPHAEAFYSDSGFFNTEYAKEESPPSLSLNYLSGSVEFQQGIFITLGIAATALLLGFYTRTATLLCWVLLISVHVRNPFVLIGGDTLLRMLLFWSLFIPLGKAWSLDQWLAIRRRSLPNDKSPAKNQKQKHLLATAGTACLILQLCVMYWCAGVSKFTEPWLNGTAMEHVLRLDLYVRPFGEWTLTQPWLLYTINYSTLVIELLAPFLLFIPFWTDRFRLLAILIFVGMHLGIELAIDVGNFGLVSMVAWIPLIPGCVWNACRCKKSKHDSCEAENEPVQKLVAEPDEAKRQSSSQKTVTARLAGCFQTCVPLFFLLYILLWNYYGLAVVYGKRWQPDLPDSYFRLGWVTMVSQNFQMFGDPPRFNPTYVFAGRNRKGDEIDLIRHQSAEKSRPDQNSKQPVSEQWKKLHRFLLRHPGNQKFHQALLDYYTRVWNENHSSKQQVIDSRLECYYEKIGPEFQAGSFVRRPDLATWKAAGSSVNGEVEKSDDEIIDDVDSFLKSLEQGPIR